MKCTLNILYTVKVKMQTSLQEYLVKLTGVIIGEWKITKMAEDKEEEQIKQEITSKN